MPRVFRHSLTVPNEAVDVHGHVNNLEYLRWMQEAAVQHSAAQGWPPERYMETGESWFVRSHSIDYLRPAVAGDDLSILTWVAGFESRRSPRRYWCVRDSDHQVLAKAETVWIYVDLATGRAIPIREELKQDFEFVSEEDEVTAFLELMSE
jgi:acyl-CoA thioester hydrolase